MEGNRESHIIPKIVEYPLKFEQTGTYRSRWCSSFYFLFDLHSRKFRKRTLSNDTLSSLFPIWKKYSFAPEIAEYPLNFRRIYPGEGVEGTDHPPPSWQTPETHLGHSRKSVITSIGTYDRLKSMPRVFASAELNGKKKKKKFTIFTF